MSGTDWPMFVITSIYVIATIVICYYNSKSAKAAQEQIKVAKDQIAEMIKQYDEAYRPVITIRFETIRNGLMCFVIENTGSVAATNINILINKDFIKNLKTIDSNIRITEYICSELFLAPCQKVFISIGGIGSFDKIAEIIAKFNITYNGKSNHNYNEFAEVDLKRYAHTLLYNSEIEEISTHLQKMETEEKHFHEKYLNELKNNKPINVIVHSANDKSKKFELYKTVCLNPGKNVTELAELVQLTPEETLEILIELEKVDRFIYTYFGNNDIYQNQWYRK